MIVNVGGRTDIVNHYTEWFLNRLEEGSAYVRNPLFPHKVSRCQLDPSVVDCIVFCSKDYRPILPHMHDIVERYGVYCFYSITAYGTDIEPNIPDIDTSIQTLLELSRIVGSERVVWRYEPVLLTDAYTAEVHAETFDRIAAQVAGHVDRCIFGFVEQYERLKKSLPGFVPLDRNGKTALAQSLGSIAAAHGLALQACCETGDYRAFGIERKGCATLATLGRANNCQFRTLKHKGLKPGCRCFESRDIGAYDTCPSSCLYCYANTSATKSLENYRQHDPYSPLLDSTIGPDDVITDGPQRSLLLHSKQDALFI